MDTKAVRKRKRISLRKLAELTGISMARLSELENGISYPKGDEMERITKALGGEKNG